MAKIVDPVCQIELDEKPEDLACDYEDKTYYFCSEDCKNEFEDDPEKFIRPSKKEAA